MPHTNTSGMAHHPSSSLRHVGQVHNDQKYTASLRDSMAEELERMSRDTNGLTSANQGDRQWQAIDRSKVRGDSPWHGIADLAKGQGHGQAKQGNGDSMSRKGSSLKAEHGSVGR